MSRLLVLLCMLMSVPVLAVLGSWLLLDGAGLAALAHLGRTVLPGYAGTSLLLVVCVGVGVAVLGGATAATVSLFEFPLRRFFEWALLLPMAMPAYVLAYAYTDFLQYSGPLQTALRDALGVRQALWPDVRNVWAAAALFVLSLYPYAYLLTRTALGERAAPLMEAARLLGAPLLRRVTEVALPLARPALVAGVALAVMETLADYGVGSYFGLTTFTTGIYRSWLVMNDPMAAAQLASMLLLLVAAALALEARARRRLRFAATRRGAGTESRSHPLTGVHAAVAISICALPVLLGFVVPVAILLGLIDMQAAESVSWTRFARWSWTSFQLAGSAALLAAALALALAYALRVRRRPAHGADPLRLAARVVSLGYAVPGAVVAVGILLPIGALQAAWPNVGIGTLISGTTLGLLYAYLVRFSAVALQSIEAGYARVPPSVDETARMLGTQGLALFFRLHLPLLQRSAFAAMLLVFVDVMKELPATLVLRPFDSDTLAVVAYQLARDERLGEAALPSLAIVAVGLLPVLMLSNALRRKR